jgi:hypothetical protein
METFHRKDAAPHDGVGDGVGFGDVTGEAVGVGDADAVGVALVDGAPLEAEVGVGDVDGVALGVGTELGVGDGDGVGVGVGDGVGFSQTAGQRTWISVAVCPARAFSMLAPAVNLPVAISNNSVLASGL